VPCWPCPGNRRQDRVLFCVYKGDLTSPLLSCPVCLSARSLAEELPPSPSHNLDIQISRPIVYVFSTVFLHLPRTFSCRRDLLSVVTGSSVGTVLHSAFVLKETIIVTYSSLPASRTFAFLRLSHDTLTLRQFDLTQDSLDRRRDILFPEPSNISSIRYTTPILTMPALRKRPSITPPMPTPPTLDRRNSSPSRQQCPGNATSILSKVVSIAPPRSTPSPLSSIPSSPNPSLSEGKAQWEAFNRRSSDNNQGMHYQVTCSVLRAITDDQSTGYISFPDFDRVCSSSRSSTSTMSDYTPST